MKRCYSSDSRKPVSTLKCPHKRIKMTEKGQKDCNRRVGSGRIANPGAGDSSIADNFLTAETEFSRGAESKPQEEWQTQRHSRNKNNKSKPRGNDAPPKNTGNNKAPLHNNSHSSRAKQKDDVKRKFSDSRPSTSSNRCHSNSRNNQNDYKSSSTHNDRPRTQDEQGSRAPVHRPRRDDFDNRTPYLSYTKLVQISAKDSTDIIRTLANSRSGLDEFLKEDIKPDHMYLIVKILSKLTASDWEENKENILIRSATPEFFKKISTFVSSLATDEHNYKRKDEMENFFENLLIFFQSVMIMLPSVAADHMTVPLRATSIAMNSVTEYQDVNISDNLKEKMKQILFDFEERKKEKLERERIEREEKEPVYPCPLGSISNIPLHPRPEDISNNQGAVPANKIKGPYNNVEHYLDVQFRLLREDFIGPVRQGINEFRGHCDGNSRKRRINNIRIYPRVKFLKPKVIEDKVGYDICFDMDKKLKVNWEQTKRFIFGSLLLFTTDKFHSFFIATVVKRDLNAVNKDRVVTVILADTNIKSTEILSKEFVMAESEVYFEPYYNVLKALQKFNNDSFPMKRYLVYVEQNTRPPAYTKNGGDCYTITGNNNITKTIKLFEDHSWPSCQELGFDISQLNAFKAALTNDLAVIQGPPGTGKTFLGLKIAEALLQNSAMWNYGRKAPILVICYTNHALDQFLEGIVNLTNNIVRVGGRSKSEILEPFNLRERRKSIAYYSANHEQAALLRDLKRQMSEVFENIKILQDNIEHLNLNEGILSVKNLSIVMVPHHIDYFRSNDDLLQWLLCGVTRQVDSKQKLISTDDKAADVRKNRKQEGYGLDSEDFENIERLKEVLFDSLELEESDNSTNSSIQLYYMCTLDEIQKKLEEIRKVLDDLPTSELPRDEIKRKMRECSAAESDLKLIYSHFQHNLKFTSVPDQADTNKLYAAQDVNSLSSVERWILYKSWIEFLKSGFFMMIGQLEERYRRGARRYEEVRQFDDLRLVQQADVIGITTSTAARLQAMLRELRPKIVIVEEAAEVLEAHIVASLSVYCQHLILIGDHKQLRPSPSNHRLEVEAHLGVSLFERLVMNGVAYHTLTTQHRMKPCISSLLVPNIYEKLNNHHSTLARRKIRGMDKDLFFMTHDRFEQEVSDIVSKKNPFEAQLVMALARHLLLQGYRPDEITVLATYKGQMYLLKEEQRRLEISPDLLVTVVDNFQGEENRIILLSLVRSNSENRIGFLKTENRMCVALSRARDGLYVFGNMDCLTADSKMWQKIKHSFEQQNAFGPALILRCETHRKEITRVLCANDFLPVAEGGCTQLCGETLACGHSCKSLCHVSKDRHTTYRCSEQCLRMCADRHRCQRKCYQECGPCNLPMSRTLDCGHQIVLPCYHEYKTIQCKEPVLVKFPICNHELNIECFRKNYTQCPLPCPYRLEDCGHSCVKTCHTQDDPDHLQYKCEKPCARQPVGCRTESHTCRLKCHEPCQKCHTMVVRKLECGHSVTVKCSQTAILCQVPCTRVLDCGHPCPNLCYDECGPCTVVVERTVPLCGHKVQIACMETAAKQHCEDKCSVTLSCGHKCSKRCKDPCAREDCLVPVEVRADMPCGHRGAMVPCNMAATINQIGSSDRERVVRYCSEPCLAVLKCGHRCSGTCGECMQGRIHKVCDEDCNNTLICGHSCPVPCRQACPPCEKKCTNRCVHSKCSKKCGEPCVPCNEPCTYQCPHLPCSRKCGQLCNRPPCDQACLNMLTCNHPCVGFCGEPCPPCKQCEPHHYEEFFYTGEETEDDTRWILLNDCKHVVDSVNMERWLNRTEDKEESEGSANRSMAIQMKTCPKCSHTAPNRFILTTLRYMNLVKATFTDIQAVKLKIFGEIKKIREERKDLLKKIEKMQATEMDLPGLDENKDELSYLLFRLLRDLPLQKNQRRNEIDTMQLRVLNYMSTYLVNMKNRRDTIWKHLNDEAKQKMSSKVNMLTQALLQRTKNITAEDVDSFNLEMERIIRFGDLLILWSSNEYKQLKTNTQVSQCYQRAEDLVNQFVKYDRFQDTKVSNAIEDLRNVIKSNAKLSADEIKQIRAAMAKDYYGGSSAQGHWFKCPNGHIYTITECGGAMQTARCPVDKCGELIGGQNHTYVSNVRLATEMDGASRPAWSTGFDMRNFDLNNLH